VCYTQHRLPFLPHLAEIICGHNGTAVLDWVWGFTPVCADTTLVGVHAQPIVARAAEGIASDPGSAPGTILVVKWSGSAHGISTLMVLRETRGC
jgi:hypothetical protein